MKSLKQGVVLGSGSRASIIEKVNPENIYIRQPQDKKTGQSPLRIIPTQVVSEVFRAVKSKRITLADINRSNRSTDTHLFDELGLDFDKYILGYDATIAKLCEYLLEHEGSQTDAPVALDRLGLPKPFILLAGISGTGKSRYVRKQAEASDPTGKNYCHVAVRPDWHEPSDLLGYISRIGKDGTRYVSTDVLSFMAQAWIEAADSADSNDKIILKDNITPYWLCLDEMNLAPVEQYFADFLSILETREWENGEYSCRPLLKPDVINKLDPEAQNDLRKNLGMEAEEHTPLWESFIRHGIEIPPNLIVAGTVNMDETTHGFSRKVIDRAMTLDFGEFFPNDFDLLFDGQPDFKTLTYSKLTQVKQNDLESVAADNDGRKSIGFLKQVNKILKDTPFELAYRALNELLLSVVCFSPKNDEELKAVWDDFLMMKVLPRIEGDGDKLQEDGDGNNLLTKLKALLEGPECFDGLQQRPDFLRKSAGENTPLMPPLRSLIKISRMNERLQSRGFTAFWP